MFLKCFQDVKERCSFMKKYYHVCSPGLERNLIFASEEEFISGVNDIAICLTKFDITIVCFCLMSNHFHFVIYGEEEECCAFAEEYKRRCGMRMRQVKQEVNALQNIRVELNEVSDDVYLENAIAYVLRNPLAAKIHIMPYHYPWSSASVYFRGNSPINGTCVNHMSERKRHRVLKSKLSLPDEYLIDERGMIFPETFVDATITERLFRHPSRLLFALAKKVEPEVELNFGVADRILYTDSELRSLVNELIVKEFGAPGLSSLTSQQKIRLCVLMRKNYNASVKQISRIARVGVDVLEKIL